ncbi:maleylpyruvate isomerase N-terminal domain-containing protein [Nocardia sp. CA-151230]|uniref:maleylpyruvate isomerase N-terminal domain-containing protein n=1 Tax=Nocardia sp. CA-151230 TaxID=3239982 RepID=UPI003D927A72
MGGVIRAPAAYSSLRAVDRSAWGNRSMVNMVGGRTTTMKASERVSAFRRERAEVVSLCKDLDDAEWRTQSRAAGWRVHDVVAHMGSGCRAVFGPAVVTFMRSADVERTNEVFVIRRREWSSARVLAEYERWSRYLATGSALLARTPVKRMRLPLAELGRFPAGLLLPGAMLFDHHIHLRFDIAPALGRTVPPTDPVRMAGVVEWMFAVLSNQLRSAENDWLAYPLDIVLNGSGGGIWRVHPGGAVTAGCARGAAAATVEGQVDEFPEWATSRAAWRDRSVRISGDENYAARFLDSVNVV